MDMPRRRRSWTRLFLKDLRGPTVVFLGAIIYLLLFAAFGSSSSHVAERKANFPRKIWQSWKVDSLSLEERDAQRARSWIKKNPTFRHETLTDDNGLSYVQEVFGPSRFNRPDVIQAYESIQAKIVQADLLRYIIMYAEGGIYADIDVEALKPFDKFIPDRFHEEDLDMVIGVETDEPEFQNHPILGVKSQSFCQWVFICKPRLPVMMRLIDNILAWLQDLAIKQSVPISQLHFGFDEVLNGTGPSAFTAALLAEMTDSSGKKITWNDFHDLQESKTVGRVLVLPSESFAAGTGHSDSGNHYSRRALVKHHFHASYWTKEHPRFKHPIYGEVERCNWDKECVKLWDLNTAFFNALPEEDQLKMIGLKEVEASKTPKIEPNLGSQSVLESQPDPHTGPAEADNKPDLGMAVSDEEVVDFEVQDRIDDVESDQSQDSEFVELQHAQGT